MTCNRKTSILKLQHVHAHNVQHGVSPLHVVVAFATAIYTTQIDGIVCPPNISETVGVETHEIRTSPTYCLDNDKTNLKINITVHFINFILNIFSESSLTRSANCHRHLIRPTPFPVSVTQPRVRAKSCRYLLCFANTQCG